LSDCWRGNEKDGRPEVNDERFLAIVDADVKGEATTDEITLLEMHLDAWRDALKNKIEFIQNTMSSRKARSFNEPENINEYMEWKSKAVRYKTALINRLKYVKEMISKEERKERGSERDELMSVLYEIRDLLKNLAVE
jgi:hypothetical protein